CLLRFRDLASKFLFSNVKNGTSTSFWYDSWTAYGHLVDVFGTDGTRRLRIRIDASVADACKLYSWGMQVTLHCCICSAHEETRDHLLLSCPYVLEIWYEIRRRLLCHVPTFNSWSDLMLWTCASAPTAPNVLKMLVIQTLTYSIWQQRNNMLHNKSLILALVLFKDINRQVINFIHVLRKRKKFRNLMTFWLI
ncbi:hypothetical protein F2Q70_00024940, partial [Brassica cretica]